LYLVFFGFLMDVFVFEQELSEYKNWRKKKETNIILLSEPFDKKN